MKRFQSTKEGVWVEQVLVQLTDEEKQLMLSQEESDVKEKQYLLERIKEDREKPTTTEKLDALISFYQFIKPKLKETDLYNLISCDLVEHNNGSYEGILNHRINDHHKQLRYNFKLS
jgi:hypothetical protein